MRFVCISHRKDVDGLGAAAIVAASTQASIVLSDYDDLIANMKEAPEGIDGLLLCDLGTDNADLGDFLSEARRVTASATFTYIDHHAMSTTTRNKLRRAGVRLVHDEKECSSVLAYKTFEKSLPPSARKIALYGAVTDYMDDSPLSKKMMEQFDRQMVLLEATMLSYALGRRAGTPGFAERIVSELADMKQPHEMEGVPEAAEEQLAEMTALADEVKAGGKKQGRLAYMMTDQYSTGNVAKLLIGAFGVPLGVALKEKNEGWYEVSLRGTSDCKIHLGRTLAKLSGQLGGSGGGHAKAAGCRIPVAHAERLLLELSRRA